METGSIAGEAVTALVGGSSVLALNNGNDVVLKLKTTPKGVRQSDRGRCSWRNLLGMKIRLLFVNPLLGPGIGV